MNKSVTNKIKAKRKDSEGRRNSPGAQIEAISRGSGKLRPGKCGSEILLPEFSLFNRWRMFLKGLFPDGNRGEIRYDYRPLLPPITRDIVGVNRRKETLSNLRVFVANLSLGLIFLLALAGCRHKAERDYIEYWSSSNVFEIEFARKIVAEWNSDSTHREVRLQPVPEGQSSEEIVLAAIVGKTTPDIYSNTWPGAIEQYRDAGVILAFNRFPDFMGYLRERLPDKLEEQFRSSDGQFYQFPWKGNPVLMAYNKALLNDYLNSDLPHTYRQFYQIGEKLRQRLKERGGKQIWMLDPNITPIWWQRFFDFYPFYVSATQGKTFITPGKKVLLDIPESRRVFQFFRQGYETGLMPISLFKEDIFLMNRLVFHLTGPWSIPHYKKFAPEGFEWGYTSIPVPEEGMLPYTYGDAKNIIIFSDTKYPEDCWEFIKFMTSRQNDLLLMRVTQQLPLRKDLLRDTLFTDFFTEYPDMRIFAEHIPYIVGLDQSLYLQEIFDMISKTWDEIVIYRAKDIETGLADLNHQVQVQVNREK